MPHHSSRRLWVPLAVAALALLPATRSGHAGGTVRTWLAPTGGSFHTPGNWDPSGVPGAADTALFDIGSTFAVTFAGGATAGVLNVAEGDVTFELGGSTFALSGLIVGDDPAEVGGLRVPTGTITVDPVDPPNFVRLGKDATAEGTLVIIGTLTSGEVVIVGDAGFGSLVVDAGGDATLARTFVADDSGSSGGLVVDDAGSTLVIQDVLFVGNGGTGTVDVTDGGTLTTNGTFVADDPGATGSIVVTGPGSSWSEVQSPFLGNRGIGSLSVLDGGSVTWTGLSRLGDDPGAEGEVLIDGAGSTITVQSELFVGNAGRGTIEVRAGGALMTNRVKLGDEPGAIGSVLVTGPASSWTDDDEIIVGNAGAGTLTIANGADVSGQRATIGDNGGADGTMIITEAGSSLTSAQQITVGNLGRGMLTLESGGQASAPAIVVGADGTLTGSGTLTGALTNGGTVATGELLSVDGSFMQTADGLLEIEIGCAGAGRVVATGNAQLAGGIEITFVPGADVVAGQQFIVLSAAAVSGTFGSFTGPPGVDITIGGGSVVVTATEGLPEPIFPGAAPGDRFGHAVANAGDVDADGVDDIVVGAPWNDANGTSAGRIAVYSGATWAPLLLKSGGQAGNRLGWSVASAGDVDGDGHDDVIAGAPDYRSRRGRVRVYSGRTGQVLYTKKGARSGDRFGRAVAGGVDIDNDGRDDFIVGAPFNDDAGTKAGKVYVYSGRDGARLGTIEGEQARDALGWSVAGLRKANGDGFADFVVGAPKNDERASNAGKVYVVSGKNFTVLYDLTGKAGGDQFGRSLTAMGRVDGDARHDFAVGSPYADRSSAARSGRVDVFSGRDGDRLWTKKGQTEGERYGWALSAADVDGDGRRDLLGAAPFRDGAAGASAGRVTIRSGLTGATLGTVDGNAGGDWFGYGVAGLGDLDGDGIEDYAIGAPKSDDAGVVVLRPSSACTGAQAVWNDDEVAAVDVLSILSAWGTCMTCLEDRNGDGRVDLEDVLAVLEGM